MKPENGFYIKCKISSILFFILVILTNVGLKLDNLILLLKKHRLVFNLCFFKISALFSNSVDTNMFFDIVERKFTANWHG